MSPFESHPVTEEQLRESMERDGVVIPKGRPFSEALSNLVDKGMLTVVMIRGVRHYRPNISLKIGKSRS